MAQGSSQAAEQIRLMWRVAGLAFMLSAEVAAAAGIGWLIDRAAGTGSRWLTLCAVIGIVVGLFGFLRAAFKLNRSIAETQPRASRSPRSPRSRDDPDPDRDRDHPDRD